LSKLRRCADDQQALAIRRPEGQGKDDLQIVNLWLNELL
jgi:hypothetical protein